MRYEIIKAMHADDTNGRNVAFVAGQIITEADMLAGCLDGGLKRQTIRALPEPEKESPKPPAQKPKK